MMQHLLKILTIALFVLIFNSAKFVKAETSEDLAKEINDIREQISNLKSSNIEENKEALDCYDKAIKLNPTKNLTTFEGGMITSKAKKISEFLRKSRNHGIDKSLKDRFTKGLPWEFDIEELGFNFRLNTFF